MTGKLPTREELISICERAIVPQEKWKNRDSESAQHNVGRVWQLLKCGCKFEIIFNNEGNKIFFSNENIWVIEFLVHSFIWFENCIDDDDNQDGYKTDSKGNLLRFYIPTEFSLKKANGGDWY